MIDLSCHFLHGPDCGPASFAESLELCRTAGNNGVRTIVMTPRWKTESAEPPMPLAQIDEQLAALREALGAAIDLKFGFMLQYSPELPRLVDRFGNVLALGRKKHLLISLPANQIPENVGSVWKELSRRGFKLIVSQPESRPALRRQPEELRTWVAGGVKLQISAAGILGWHGREVKRTALQYVEKYGENILLASNGHIGNGGVPSLRDARDEISKTFPEQARKCSNDLPSEVLGLKATAQAAAARTFVQRFSFLRSLMSW